jgi:hypothetical protein
MTGVWYDELISELSGLNAKIVLRKGFTDQSSVKIGTIEVTKNVSDAGYLIFLNDGDAEGISAYKLRTVAGVVRRMTKKMQGVSL